MDLSLVFIHGEMAILIPLLVGLLIAFIVFIGIALLFYIWVWHTKLSVLYPALAYLMSVAALSFLLAVSAADSVLSFILAVSGFILTLPWSSLADWGWGIRAPRESGFAVVMLFGAVVNALILHFIAGKIRRVIKKRRLGTAG